MILLITMVTMVIKTMIAITMVTMVTMVTKTKIAITTVTTNIINYTLQDIFMRLEIATTEILAVRKYGEISQKPSHFGPHSK